MQYLRIYISQGSVATLLGVVKSSMIVLSRTVRRILKIGQYLADMVTGFYGPRWRSGVIEHQTCNQQVPSCNLVSVVPLPGNDSGWTSCSHHTPVLLLGTSHMCDHKRKQDKTKQAETL